MNRLTYFPLILLIAAPVFADTTPLPDSYLGNVYVSFASPDANPFPWSNLIGPFPAGYGGAFQADVYNNPSGPAGNPVLTSVWCVDYQLDIEPGDEYSANITALASIATPTDSNVRYGDQTADWTNPVTDPSNSSVNTNTAAYRYALTAALVSQYEDGNSSINSPLTTSTSNPVTNPDPTNPVNNSVNQAIQTAIWYITDNHEYGPSPFAPGNYGVSQGNPASSPSNYLYWVNWAENNVGSVNLNDWAVISGPVNSDGALQIPDGHYQTFLVQLASPTPEPSFYGIVAVALAGLFFARFRSKTLTA